MRMKIVLVRIFNRVSSLRERPVYEQKGAAKQRGAPRRGDFANGRVLNVTKASKCKGEKHESNRSSR